MNNCFQREVCPFSSPSHNFVSNRLLRRKVLASVTITNANATVEETSTVTREETSKTKGEEDLTTREAEEDSRKFSKSITSKKKVLQFSFPCYRHGNFRGMRGGPGMRGGHPGMRGMRGGPFMGPRGGGPGGPPMNRGGPQMNRGGGPMNRGNFRGQGNKGKGRHDRLMVSILWN